MHLQSTFWIYRTPKPSPQRQWQFVLLKKLLWSSVWRAKCRSKKVHFQMLPITWTTKPPLCHEDLERWKTTQSRSLDRLFGKKGRKGPDYLKGVLDCVSKERHEIFELKKPAGATLEIGPLEDTIYSEQLKVVNGWGKFYLPEIVSMQVVGVVEGTSCPSDQLVLMICEDEKLYAYDGVELHLVASSPKQLDEEGIEYPASKTYYEGEAFKDMTKVDWEEVRKGPTGRRLERVHHKLVTKNKAKFMEYLKVKAAIKDGPSQKPVTSPQVLVSR
ncbi:hypothetical protein NQZ68_040168 [Dissostichus eleginoides]|nr:hypothetical protein NQZ68_040168 [Dissostichus eleginoides]